MCVLSRGAGRGRHMVQKCEGRSWAAVLMLRARGTSNASAEKQRTFAHLSDDLAVVHAHEGALPCHHFEQDHSIPPNVRCL